MSLWDYMHTPGGDRTPSARQGPTADEVVSFAERILYRIEDLPTDPTDRSLAPENVLSVLRMVGSHWGVYGVGVAGVAPGGFDSATPGQFWHQILLDPAWLDRDFRARARREPWLFASEAEWATTRLRNVLDLDIPPQTVLRASLPPEPQAFSSGARSTWPAASAAGAWGSVPPRTGTVGPPVLYTDDAGNTAEGYLTAGHVVPPWSPAAGLAQVDIQTAAGTVSTVDVSRSHVPPGGIGTGVAKALSDAIDAAIIHAGGHSVRGLGPSGAAGRLAPVDRVVAGSNRAGEVVGYSVWVATETSAWRDCYLVAASNGNFSVPGHSGAAVTKSTEIIGIVLGAAASVGGCGSALTYVQDIDAITSYFNCSVIP